MSESISWNESIDPTGWRIRGKGDQQDIIDLDSKNDTECLGREHLHFLLSVNNNNVLLQNDSTSMIVHRLRQTEAKLISKTECQLPNDITFQLKEDHHLAPGSLITFTFLDFDSQHRPISLNIFDPVWTNLGVISTEIIFNIISQLQCIISSSQTVMDVEKY